MELEPILLTTQQAADYLKIAKSDLDRSRISGELAGVEAPPFIRIGKRVRYMECDLRTWIAQFGKFTSIASENCSVHG